MKKTIKIINLIIKVANGEEVPKKIKYDDNVMFYSSYDKDYLVSSDGEYIGLINNCEVSRVLNDEVEIISDEEEFEDIKPLEQIVMKKAFYKDANDLAKDVSISFEKIDDIVISINDLIKNQKKIIEKLRKNNNIQ